jgi:hypothetical protein
MTPKAIGFLGDIHCGSHHGLWPLDDLPGGKRGSKYKGVRYLNSCYANMIDQWPDLDILILMGDLIDGKQRKSNSTGLFTAQLGDQVKGAIEVLTPLSKKAKKIIRVKGTPYHEEFEGALNDLDSQLGINLTDHVLNLNINDHILNVAHHPVGGSSLYLGTSVDKENIWSSVAAIEKSVPNIRWIFRGHKHTFIHQETVFKQVCLVPCFELPTPYAIKNNYWRFQPIIGGVLLMRDDSEILPHPTGYRVVPTTFELPDPVIHDLIP